MFNPFLHTVAKCQRDRSFLQNWILVQAQGGTAMQPAGILKYVEDLERDPNNEIGTKDFFETAYSL
jgi:hypothetical protein